MGFKEAAVTKHKQRILFNVFQTWKQKKELQ